MVQREEVAMRMKTIALATAAAFCLSVPALAEEGITDQEIRIGNVLPMSTPAALVGRAAHLGSVVAAAEINAGGGVAGRKVVIQTEDDGYVPARTVQGLRKLMDDGVVGLIGTGAGAGTAAILPILEEEGIPAIVSFSPLEAAIDPIKPTVFMLGASYQDLVYAQLRYVHENREPENPRYGAIRQDDDFGVQVEEAFQRAVDEFKLDAAPVIRFKRGQKDFGAELLKIRQEKVNVLVAGGVTAETPAIMKEARRYQITPLELATVPTSMLPPIMGLAAPHGYKYLSGDYIAPLGSEGGAHFEEMARQHLSEEEFKALNRYAITGYVATHMMVEALRRCGDNLTRACAVEKLASGEPFETYGITEPLSFAADRHIAATAVRVLEVDPMSGTITELTEFVQY